MIITWIDSGREPKETPDPAYPDGIDLDLSNGKTPACIVEVPYPAKRIGHYRVECDICGRRIAFTTAGRPDDPRTVKFACKTQGKFGMGKTNGTN